MPKISHLATEEKKLYCIWPKSAMHCGMKHSILTPTSSTIILSSPTGPRELLTMLATELAAITVENLNKYNKHKNKCLE